MSGWTIVPVPGHGVHCVPIKDTRDHQVEDCPCKPEQFGPFNAWVHNSFDGREAFEEGERKPS